LLLQANSATPTIATISGEVSTQPWDLIITPPVPGACFYTGLYALIGGFQIQCALTNTSNCPVINNDTVDITLNVLSENFCGQVAQNVPITSVLQPFQDAGFTTPFSNFLVNDGQTSFFRMVVTSTAVSITTIDIQSIILQSSGSFLVSGNTTLALLNLYSSGTWQVTTVSGSLGSAVTNNGTQGFSFQVSSGLFQIPLDNVQIITVEVVATVSYLGGKKRSITAQFVTPGTQKQISSTLISLTQSFSHRNEYSIISLLAALLLVISFN
jgi:hypothetical protein